VGTPAARKARVFTDEELRIGSLRSIDAMAEALSAGDEESALRFSRRLRREVLSMFQNYDGWELSLRRFIVELAGPEAESTAIREIEDPEKAPETPPSPRVTHDRRSARDRQCMKRP
jgi:hypothetical protein